MRHLLAIVSALALAVGVNADQQPIKDMGLFPAAEIKWGAGPPSLQKGAAMAVLEGDPVKEGMFTMRLKMPDGFVVAPHVRRTPVLRAQVDGRPLVLKLEHLQRGGSFKLRGAVNALAARPLPTHVVTASGGNHGTSTRMSMRSSSGPEMRAAYRSRWGGAHRHARRGWPK